MARLSQRGALLAVGLGPDRERTRLASATIWLFTQPATSERSKQLSGQFQHGDEPSHDEQPHEMPPADRFKALFPALSLRLASVDVPPGPPGAAAQAWAATHLAVAVLWIAVAIGRVGWLGLGLRLLWIAACSGMPVRILAGALSGRPVNDRPTVGPKKVEWSAGLWFCAFAVVSGLEGAASVPELVAVSVLVVGARVAGMDSWLGDLRAPGYYLRMIRSPIGLLFIFGVPLGIITLDLVGPLLERLTNRSLVFEEQAGLRLLFFAAYAASILPGTVVAELIAGVARSDQELQYRRAEAATQLELTVVRDQLHSNVFSLIAIAKSQQSRPDSLGPTLQKLERALIDIQRGAASRSGPAYIGSALIGATSLIDAVGLRSSIGPEDILSRLLDGHTAGLLGDAVESLVSNSVKSGASSVDIYLSLSPDDVHAFVTDDGPGFDPSVALDAGRGLSTLRRRLSAADGEISFAGVPCRTVGIRLPRHA